MATPIKMTAEIIDKMVEEFRQTMEKYKSSDGKVKYEHRLPGEDTQALLYFTPTAYAKMLSIVREVNQEVAWHGVVERLDGDLHAFLVTDILVYPQYVAGATVKTDTDEYGNWLYSLEDDVFNNLRMQGHSHVNFQCSPSGTDSDNQRDFLSQLSSSDGAANMFYIFIIWNKKHEHWFRIYDMENNIMFDNDDVVFSIWDDDVDLDLFVDESLKMVKKQADMPQEKKPAAASNTNTGKPKAATTVVPANASDYRKFYEEEDDIYGNPYNYEDYYSGKGYGKWSRKQLADPFYYGGY